MTLLHPEGFEFPAGTRLAGLGFAVQTFDPIRTEQMAAERAEAVFLIPDAATRAGLWARLRVELNRSNRFYVLTLDRPDTAAVVRAMRDGACDVVAASDDDARWREAIAGAAQAQAHWQQLYGVAPLTSGEVLLGRSETFQRLRQTLDKLGPTDVTVLIQGESGVGKEKVAEALHRASRRKVFVSLNCAAIPRDLLESELFGVEKGAFTGAIKARPGLVEQAAGGTLFLDEIGELDPAVQPKLLRVLETRRARRVGGEADYAVSARFVAATNRNLETEITAGRFRLDLFYRLAEIVLQVPPLRARPEDIPELAMVFLTAANERFGKHFLTLEPGLLERFQRHPWPGNVRELKSSIDRMVLLFDGSVLRDPWWEAPPPPPALTPAPPEPVASPAALSRAVRSGPLPDGKAKIELAREMVARGENFTSIAAQLGVNPSTIFRWRQAGKV